MTDAHTGPTVADIMEEDPDATSVRLEREADAILMADQQRALAAPTPRRAVGDDVSRLRGAVRAEPVKASLYALALGVVIGLLIAR